MTQEPVIKIDNLNKRFDHVRALTGVNLEIQPGSIIGLLGANGGGKSTLLRHMVGFYLPDQGSCVTLGREAADLEAEQISRIGYVHQEGELNDWMTVLQMIRFVAAHYPTWNENLENDYIDRFELSLDTRVGVLSPGQRQKLAILLAIGFEPELLILDEPAAALDPVARHRFLELLLEIIQNGKRTIIISSHILSDVEKVIDHTIIMDRGKILRDCSFDRLLEEFQRVRLTSLNGPLPVDLAVSEMIRCEQTETQALLTMKSKPPEMLETLAKKYHCDIEPLPLSFEEIYTLVVQGREEKE